ncbi:MAG: class III poly(R)-hydroxyalkanoic acid synthase subunit PhaC [Anaerolineae bacterium]
MTKPSNMQLPIDEHPGAIASEIAQMNQKALEGVRALSRLEGDNLNAGASVREAVFTNDHVTLFRYQALVAQPYPVPVLIVYAMVNRPYMLDLQEDRSLIRRLLESGLDVYMIDWGYPERNDRWLTLEDYIDDYLTSCVDYIRRAHRLDAIHLLGVCQGGVLSLCYAALHPERVARLITMATSVDFHIPEGVLNAWVRDGMSDTDTIDLMVEAMGNIPGDAMNFGFLMLKPFELGMQKYMTLLDSLLDSLDHHGYPAGFLRMEKWIFDCPDQAGEAWRQYLKHFYVENRLMTNSFYLDGRHVDFRRVTMPVLNIYAENDHLVPPASSTALRQVVNGAPYTEASFPVGHIGLYVSSSVQQRLPALIVDWLCLDCGGVGSTNEDKTS